MQDKQKIFMQEFEKYGNNTSSLEQELIPEYWVIFCQIVLFVPLKNYRGDCI